MIDIRINVSCPDLVTAAGLLAGARGAPVPPQEAPKPSPITAPIPAPTPAPQAPPAANVAPQTAPVTPPPQPQPQGNVVPMTAPPVQAPTAGPSYTAADIARAGAALIQANPGIQPQLQALLQQFGVQAAMDLKPEQLGTFANALRGMGAKL